MAGIDEGVVQVRADDEDEFTEGGLVFTLTVNATVLGVSGTRTDTSYSNRACWFSSIIDAVEALKSKVTRKKGRGFGGESLVFEDIKQFGVLYLETRS